MNWKNTTARYGLVTIGLHWLTLVLLIAVYACVNLTELYEEESPAQEALMHWHYMLGLTVLALVVLRLLNRLVGGSSAVVPPVPLWQQRLASTVHVALYVLMVAMPILGWLILSASGEPIPFFGTQLPALLTANEDLADQLEDVHEVIGTIGYFLIGAHALAALFHHYITRDNTLVRMLPGKG